MSERKRVRETTGDSENSQLLKLFNLSKIDREILDNEIKGLQEDFQKYGSGAFLWVNEIYPNAILAFSLVVGDFFSKFKVKPNMKEVVDEYFSLIEVVKVKNNELFLEEMEDSQKLVFNKILQPMDILAKKDPYIKRINQKLSEGIKQITPQFKDYLTQLEPEIKKLGSEMKEKLDILPNKELPQNLIKDIQSERDPFVMLDKIGTFLKSNKEKSQMVIEDIKSRSIDFTKQIQEIQKETLINVDDITEEFKKTSKGFKEIYDINDPSWAYQQLRLIKDLDSFHIRFTKFIARLFFILKEGNRDLKKKPFFKISEKYYKETRDKLKQFLALELKPKYQKLAKYLLFMFKYNNYRKLEAHDSPEVRIIDGVAYFAVPETQKELEMNLEEISIIINTYSFFIKSLLIY